MESSKRPSLALLLTYFLALSITGVALSPSVALGVPILFFPWDKDENPWQLTNNGPHNWGSTSSQSGLDFDKNRTPRRVLSMFDGKVTFVGHELTGCKNS